MSRRQSFHDLQPPPAPPLPATPQGCHSPKPHQLPPYLHHPQPRPQVPRLPSCPCQAPSPPLSTVRPTAAPHPVPSGAVQPRSPTLYLTHCSLQAAKLQVPPSLHLPFLFSGPSFLPTQHHPSPPTPTPFLIPHSLPAPPFSLSCPSSLCLYLQACPSLSSLGDLQKIPPLGCIGTTTRLKKSLGGGRGWLK